MCPYIAEVFWLFQAVRGMNIDTAYERGKLSYMMVRVTRVNSELASLYAKSYVRRTLNNINNTCFIEHSRMHHMLLKLILPLRSSPVDILYTERIENAYIMCKECTFALLYKMSVVFLKLL